MPASDDERRVDVGSDEYATQRCHEVVDRAVTLLQGIAELPAKASPHQPAVQVAALLLRLCGCGKVSQLLRSTLPPTTRPAARAYDTALLTCYEELAELDPFTTA